MCVCVVVHSPVTYTMKAKVLILGMGADEQLGGYSRHRTTYQRGGMEALTKELAMDFERLWIRYVTRREGG